MEEKPVCGAEERVAKVIEMQEARTPAHGSYERLTHPDERPQQWPS